MQYSHNRLIIVKRRPEKYSLQLARAEATGKSRSPSVERLVDGTTSMAESAERRRRRVSASDVQCRLLARYAGAIP